MRKVSYDPSLDVYNFRKNHSIGEFDVINCKSLLFRLGIIVLFRPLSANFSGMCIKAEKKNFILINSTHSIGKQNFTIAHELYHLYVQKDFIPHICNPCSASDVEEKKADLFASELLMPKLGIKSSIPEEELIIRSISIPTLLYLEQFYAVSHSAMVFRLFELDLINEELKQQFENLKITKLASQYGFDTSLYEKGNDNVTIGDYGIKANKLFEDRLISETRLFDLMSYIGVDLSTNKNDYFENENHS